MKKFIVFEGIDGSGKSTQSKFLANYLNGAYTFEPTDNKIGKLIREVLEGKEKFSKETLALLFAGDRIEHNKEIINLLNSSYVICDRYVYSSLAYQLTQGINLNYIMEINKFAKIPDVVIYLLVSVENALNRMDNRTNKEIFEKKEFLTKLINNYNLIIEKELFRPKLGYIIIDTNNKSIEEVNNEIIKKLEEKEII